MDTIFALASARGKAGIAVVRLSGGGAHVAVAALCGGLPALRRASLRKLVWNGQVLDEALVMAFAAGASFTGEESAEIQIHGSSAVIVAVLGALAAQPGLRLAEPGEFARRALENGCLDLAQIEGLADLIDAETESQRRQAVRVLSGALGVKVEGWRRDLIRAAALIEATIDFADEDVPVDVTPEVSQLVSGLLQSLRLEVSGSKAAERIRDGFEVAIVGSPNVGKSTLLNALAGREVAITSEIAGTTRDVIEVRMDLSGLSVTLLDTAGLRCAEDQIEQIGVERGIARAVAADLRVFLLDQTGQTLALAPLDGDIVLIGKADLLPAGVGDISGRTGFGIEALVARVTARLERVAASAGLLIRERQRIAVLAAVSALESVQTALEPELIAVDLRSAMRALEVMLGRVDVENLLDEIFSSFCIGK